MTDITNAQVIKFCNEAIRPMADSLYQAYYRAKAAVEDYNSGDIGTKIDTAGAGNNVADGAATDGRTIIVGGDVYNMVTALNAFIAYMEGGAVATAARLDVIAKPHVNGI